LGHDIAVRRRRFLQFGLIFDRQLLTQRGLTRSREEDELPALLGPTQLGRAYKDARTQSKRLTTFERVNTSNRGGTISVDVNGKDATGPLRITTTSDPADPLAWRQWHHWNLALQLFKVRLSRGKNVLTVHIATNGNMNLAYFDFKPVRR
jgi:hypothetical protein